MREELSSYPSINLSGQPMIHKQEMTHMILTQSFSAQRVIALSYLLLSDCACVHCAEGQGAGECVRTHMTDMELRCSGNCTLMWP